MIICSFVPQLMLLSAGMCISMNPNFVDAMRYRLSEVKTRLDVY
jgi:hypothetical protein